MFLEFGHVSVYLRPELTDRQDGHSRALGVCDCLCRFARARGTLHHVDPALKHGLVQVWLVDGVGDSCAIRFRQLWPRKVYSLWLADLWFSLSIRRIHSCDDVVEIFAALIGIAVAPDSILFLLAADVLGGPLLPDVAVLEPFEDGGDRG